MVLDFNYSNITAPTNARFQAAGYVIEKHNTISIPEIVLIIIIFVTLAYLYIKVSSNKEKYSVWTNPRGKIVNVYKKVRLIFWLYVAIIIILGIIQIWLNSRAGV